MNSADLFPKHPRPKRYIVFMILNCAFGSANLCMKSVRKVMIRWLRCCYTQQLFMQQFVAATCCKYLKTVKKRALF